MIKSLSPYNLTIPFVAPLSGLTCTEFTLEIFVWNGSKATPPIEPSYSKTIANPTASIGNTKVNIARLVNDFIDFTPYDTLVTELVNGNNQQWVKTQVKYLTSNVTDLLPQEINVDLMVKGYSYGMDGANAQPPSNNIFLSGIEFKVQRNGYFVLPILIQETVTPLATLAITLIEEDVAPFYDITYIETGTHDEIYYRYRLQPETFWTVGDVFLGPSPFAVELPATLGTYDVQIFTFDTINNVNVYSNIYEFIIT